MWAQCRQVALQPVVGDTIETSSIFSSTFLDQPVTSSSKLHEVTPLRRSRLRALLQLTYLELRRNLKIMCSSGRKPLLRQSRSMLPYSVTMTTETYSRRAKHATCSPPKPKPKVTKLNAQVLLTYLESMDKKSRPSSVQLCSAPLRTFWEQSGPAVTRTTPCTSSRRGPATTSAACPPCSCCLAS
jgi:hypothetical protein